MRSPKDIVREKGRSWPLYKCLCSEEDFPEFGRGSVLVARTNKVGNIYAAWYSLDVLCGGLIETRCFMNKDMMQFGLVRRTVEAGLGHGLLEVSYNIAHNWVWGAVDFAAEAGIFPPDVWNTTKYLLEDDENEDIPIIDLPFGKDGKHFLSLRAVEAPLLATLSPILDKNLGKDGWSYEIRMDFPFEEEEDGEDDFTGDDYYEESPYGFTDQDWD